jgi:two-component system, chemotaxis family, protein-glutamate methylesterase/glutaminase
VTLFSVTPLPAAGKFCATCTQRGTLIREDSARTASEGLVHISFANLVYSTAVSYGPEAVGIVLSGLMNDGAGGSRIIRRLGGAVIVQDPASAAVPDMPLASIAAGPVDFVLPTAVIAAALTTLAMQAGAAELFCGPALPSLLSPPATPLVI